MIASHSGIKINQNRIDFSIEIMKEPFQDENIYITLSKDDDLLFLDTLREMITELMNAKKESRIWE